MNLIDSQRELNNAIRILEDAFTLNGIPVSVGVVAMLFVCSENLQRMHLSEFQWEWVCELLRGKKPDPYKFLHTDE